MAVREIVIVSEPSIGLTLKIDGQEYSYTGRQDYQKIDGSTVSLFAWNTQCRNCDSPFKTLSSEAVTYMTRRCEGCRKNRQHLMQLNAKRRAEKKQS